MATPSLIFKNDALARHQKAYIDLMYSVTGAKAGKFVALPPRALVAYDNGSAPSQADIDALLGSTNEFVQATVFGSTALGTDAIALILDCDGQVASVSGIEIKSVLGTTQAAQIGAPVALADTLPANPRVAVSALGNIGVQAVLTGLDAATSGLLLIRIHCDLK
jgi:hypothetical protein